MLAAGGATAIGAGFARADIVGMGLDGVRTAVAGGVGATAAGAGFAGAGIAGARFSGPRVATAGDEGATGDGRVTGATAGLTPATHGSAPDGALARVALPRGSSLAVIHGAAGDPGASAPKRSPNESATGRGAPPGLQSFGNSKATTDAIKVARKMVKKIGRNARMLTTPRSRARALLRSQGSGRDGSGIMLGAGKSGDWERSVAGPSAGTMLTIWAPRIKCRDGSAACCLDALCRSRIHFGA